MASIRSRWTRDSGADEPDADTSPRPKGWEERDDDDRADTLEQDVPGPVCIQQRGYTHSCHHQQGTPYKRATVSTAQTADSVLNIRPLNNLLQEALK